ncbi:hypothetical protein ECRM12761_12625 [Escherichia coli O145:H28 str. RM12761]|nr:hypothetical protein ECRM13516_2577 [Escherichia coli O145:H28 str. RM13516]AHY65562.1 hypothetical protein ECRM12761_12625 [Escherichia coli O145:H28 str. RM12761]
MAIQTEALHFPGAGVNITDRGDLPLKRKRKLTAVCSHQTRIGNLDAHLI